MNMAERGQPPARLKFSASRSITMKTSSITRSKEPKIPSFFMIKQTKITFEHSKISAAIEMIFWVLVYLSSTPNELSTQLTRHCLARIIGTKQILLRPIWTRHKSFRSESFFYGTLKMRNKNKNFTVIAKFKGGNGGCVPRFGGGDDSNCVKDLKV